MGSGLHRTLVTDRFVTGRPGQTKGSDSTASITVNERFSPSAMIRAEIVEAGRSRKDSPERQRGNSGREFHDLLPLLDASA